MLKRSDYVVSDRLVNALEAGVPQDRERVFLFGIQRALIKDLGIEMGKQKSEPLADCFPWRKYAKYPGNLAFDFPWPKVTAFKADSKLPKPDGIPRDLTVQYWFEKNDVENHPNSVHYFNAKAGLKRFLTVDEGDNCKMSFKRLHRWRYSPTACYGNNEVHLHPYKARRITAAEALAIQSLPKGYRLPDHLSLSAMFKGIGNGVPFLVSRMIARATKDFIESKVL